ncbi:protein RER1 (RER1) [Vairimorpha necatrix]|uniref:Protein RER1 n=1 Tax=Vairimorpha necatrix TaxID=6039 RepID=A0AAX4JDI5_9MICR
MDLTVLTQIYLDQLAPLPSIRWGITGLLLLIYLLRIYFKESFYLLTYVLGIYLIHGTILFLTPKGENIADPFENYDQDEGDTFESELIDNQFKPITRNLPEFDYWLFSTKVVTFALFASCFSIFDIPVYTPILAIYFCMMLVFTINSLYQHTKRYNYNPFNISKGLYKD